MGHRGKLNPRVFSLVARAMVTAVAQNGGAADEITLNAGDAGINDEHNGKFITIVAGPGLGETRRVLQNISVSKVAKVDAPWITHPTNASTYVLANAISAEPQLFVVTSATANGVTLNDDQGFVNIADWYNSLMVEVVKGTGKGRRMIRDSSGATRVLSIDGLWKVTPVAGDIVRVDGHLYFPNKGVHVAIGAAGGLALKRGGTLGAPDGLLSVGAAGVILPPASEAEAPENIEYIEFATAATYTVQRWE